MGLKHVGLLGGRMGWVQHFNWNGPKLKDKFGILQLKPCFKIVSDEIEWLSLSFTQMLLSREFLDSVVAPQHFYNDSIGVQEQSFTKL